MKFSLGKADEKKQVKLYAQRDHLKKWHRYFAWYPIVVGTTDNDKRDFRCFEWIERKYTNATVICGSDALFSTSSYLKPGHVQYRTIK